MMKIQRLWVCNSCDKHEFIVLNHECDTHVGEPTEGQITTEIEIVCANCGEPYSTITAIGY